MTLAGLPSTPTRRALTTVGHAAVGVPVGLAWTVTLLTGLGVAGVAFPVGLPIAGATLVLARLGAQLERDRATALLGRRPEGEPAPLDGQGRLQRMLAIARSVSTGRDVVYLATFGPVVLALVAIAVGWVGALTLALTSGWWLPGGSVELGSLAIGRPVVVTLLALHGVGALVSTPAVARGLGRLHRAHVAHLLGAARVDLRHRAERAEHRQALLARAARAERERIERDLHDGLQPLLVSAAVTVAGAQRSLVSDPQGTARRLHEAQAHLTSAMADVRALVQGLAPRSLREAGLDAALGELAAGAAIDTDLHVALAGPVADDAAATVYYVAAEALTNAVRHSAADRVELRVTSTADGVEVDVVDTGLGGAVVRSGRGLDGLDARVRSTGGRFRIDSPSGVSTHVHALVPVEAQA